MQQHAAAEPLSAEQEARHVSEHAIEKDVNAEEAKLGDLLASEGICMDDVSDVMAKAKEVLTIAASPLLPPASSMSTHLPTTDNLELESSRNGADNAAVASSETGGQDAQGQDGPPSRFQKPPRNSRRRHYQHLPLQQPFSPPPSQHTNTVRHGSPPVWSSPNPVPRKSLSAIFDEQQQRQQMLAQQQQQQRQQHQSALPQRHQWAGVVAPVPAPTLRPALVQSTSPPAPTAVTTPAASVPVSPSADNTPAHLRPPDPPPAKQSTPGSRAARKVAAAQASAALPLEEEALNWPAMPEANRRAHAKIAPPSVLPFPISKEEVDAACSRRPELASPGGGDGGGCGPISARTSLSSSRENHPSQHVAMHVLGMDSPSRSPNVSAASAALPSPSRVPSSVLSGDGGAAEDTSGGFALADFVVVKKGSQRDRKKANALATKPSKPIVKEEPKAWGSANTPTGGRTSSASAPTPPPQGGGHDDSNGDDMFWGGSASPDHRATPAVVASPAMASPPGGGASSLLSIQLEQQEEDARRRALGNKNGR